MPNQNRLALDPDTMRRLGYRTVDVLVDRLVAPARPVPVSEGRAQMTRNVGGPPPEEAQPFEALLESVAADVLDHYGRADHPRYLAFIPGSGTWPGALADFIASATNIQVVSWHESPGPTAVETTVIDWMKGWIGYPGSASGILVSGGSAANMTALACAREVRVGPMSDDLVAYVSDQAHSSLARAARILGFNPTQLRVLPSDERLRMRPDVLEQAIAADVSAGRRPLFVAASAGSTNTGGVDPLAEIAAICAKRSVWLHVDGAYGAFAALTDEGRAALNGIENADSITLDPHKWLFQPFECGALLVREGRTLRDAFEIIPDYLVDMAAAETEINYSDMGMQLTRSMRALKVWLSVRCFGLAAFRDTIQRAMDLARRAEERIVNGDAFELMAPASLGVVCFRRRLAHGADERQIERGNRALVESLEASGDAFISSTRLHGRYALRLCILNPSTSAADVDYVLDWLERAPIPAGDTTGVVAYDRQPDVRSGWPSAGGAAGEQLGRYALFRSLDRNALSEVAAAATQRTLPAGEPIVQQWEKDRGDFFLVREGTVDVLVNGARVAALGAGEFFGELGALDWGASFSYPRLATVVAAEPTVVLVLPAALLNTLVREHADVAAQIRAAVAERVTRA
jgi:aromatic-L-amino-acid/L-tryptophan decarboxylase